MCVQRFDDSRNSAIHTTYRISLRSSSLREPRYPLLRVVSVTVARGVPLRSCFRAEGFRWVGDPGPASPEGATGGPLEYGGPAPKPPGRPREGTAPGWGRTHRCSVVGLIGFNDPSAGSPTETLLRLLLPLNGRVQRNSRSNGQENRPRVPVLTLHQHVQSVGATGGVYKGQGRNQREMMTRAY